jgi:hypothetical protein
MKLNWGHGIFITLTLFVGMMAWFMVRAIGNPEELVAEDYYQQELKYQERIERMDHATAAGEAVITEVSPGSLALQFPASVKGKVITGSVNVLKPNDSRADRTVPLVVDTAGRCVLDTREWMKGRYQIDVEWSVEGVQHLSEDHVDVR